MLIIHSRDLTLILIARIGQNLPFGYRFMLIGPIVEGLLGGRSLPITTSPTYHNRVFQEYLLDRLLDMPI